MLYFIVFLLYFILFIAELHKQPHYQDFIITTYYYIEFYHFNNS